MKNYYEITYIDHNGYQTTETYSYIDSVIQYIRKISHQDQVKIVTIYQVIEENSINYIDNDIYASINSIRKVFVNTLYWNNEKNYWESKQ